MIVACPSCATSYEFPDGHLGADGTVIRCSQCGHSWLEAHAVEITDVPCGPSCDDEPENDAILVREARRLADVTRAAEEARGRRHRERMARVRGWSIWAACLVLPVVVMAVFPDETVRIAPGTSVVYERLGVPFNVRGFEIRKVAQEHIMSDGQRVLAIRGEVVNISRGRRKVPALRFVLRDKEAKQVYAWTLNGVGARQLAPAQKTTFVTRIASPPESADDIEIRFAQAAEIGSNN